MTPEELQTRVEQIKALIKNSDAITDNGRTIGVIVVLYNVNEIGPGPVANLDIAAAGNSGAPLMAKVLREVTRRLDNQGECG